MQLSLAFRQMSKVVKSYFPKGIRAIIKRFLRFKALNVISAVFPHGTLVYHIRTSRFLGVHMADFLRKLRKTFRRRKLIVVRYKAPTHFGREVKELLRTGFFL